MGKYPLPLFDALDAKKKSRKAVFSELEEGRARDLLLTPISPMNLLVSALYIAPELELTDG